MRGSRTRKQNEEEAEGEEEVVEVGRVLTPSRHSTHPFPRPRTCRVAGDRAVVVVEWAVVGKSVSVRRGVPVRD